MENEHKVCGGVMKHSEGGFEHKHYYREWHGKIDIYRILSLYEVDDPCLQHAVKKLIVTGQRGGQKDFRRDVQDAIDTLNRKLEMLDEDEGVE